MEGNVLNCDGSYGDIATDDECKHFHSMINNIVVENVSPDLKLNRGAPTLCQNMAHASVEVTGHGSKCNEMC